MEHVFAGDIEYINIWPEETLTNSKRYSKSKKTSVGEKNNTKTNSFHSDQRTITAHDFVVRRTVFKCRHNNHHIEDVRAVFTTINRQGTVNKIAIPAGYCSACNTYFIMERTYKRIKNSGIPICRTMDEKSYESSSPTGLYNNDLASFFSLCCRQEELFC